jgi:Ca-activated chloride channel family protein
MLKRTFILIVVLLLAACGSGGTPAPTAIPADVKALSFAYDVSAQKWLDPAISAFNSTATQSADGKRLFVTGHPMGSGAMVEDMIQGNSPYDVIAPADKVWIDILADRRKQRGEAALTISGCTAIARSPVVMITWRPMAETLGWPDREFTWHDIAELALSPSAWQGYDQPDWGTLTFGHAHAVLSHGGLAATLGEAYAAGPLTPSDVQSDVVKSYLRGVERSVARYGTDTSSLVKSMADKGQRYLHVAVGYESDVIANHKGDNGLIAIYPKETFVAEYTACAVGSASGDAAPFILYLTTPEAQQAALANGFRPADPKSALGSPIDEGHGVDPDAKFQPIAMPSVDTIRAVQNTWSELKRPLNVVLIIDVSGSMNDGGKLDGARIGAKAFVDRLGNDDLLTIYTFSDNYFMALPQTRVGDSRQRILDRIDSLKASGSTALYSTITFARQSMKPDSKRINAIVVLTDGQDTVHSATLNDVLQALKQAKGAVTVYTIGYGGDVDSRVLTQIADAGNGSYFAGDPATINQVYLEIASQFGGSRGLGR